MFFLFESVRQRGWVDYGVDVRARLRLRGVFASHEEAQSALERRMPRHAEEVRIYDCEFPAGARHFQVAERVVRSLFIVEEGSQEPVFGFHIHYEE